MPDYIPPLTPDFTIHEDPGDAIGPIIYPAPAERFTRVADFELEEIERLQASVDKLMTEIIAQAVQVQKLESLLSKARAVIRVFVHPIAPMTEEQKESWLDWLRESQ